MCIHCVLRVNPEVHAATLWPPKAPARPSGLTALTLPLRLRGLGLGVIRVQGLRCPRVNYVSAISKFALLMYMSEHGFQVVTAITSGLRVKGSPDVFSVLFADVKQMRKHGFARYKDHKN